MHIDALPAREARARPGFGRRTPMAIVAALTFLVAMIVQDTDWHAALAEVSIEAWMPASAKAIVIAGARIAWRLALVAFASFGGSPLPGWAELAALAVGAAVAVTARATS